MLLGNVCVGHHECLRDKDPAERLLKANICMSMCALHVLALPSASTLCCHCPQPGSEESGQIAKPQSLVAWLDLGCARGLWESTLLLPTPFYC